MVSIWLYNKYFVDNHQCFFTWNIFFSVNSICKMYKKKNRCWDLKRLVKLIEIKNDICRYLVAPKWILTTSSSGHDISYKCSHYPLNLKKYNPKYHKKTVINCSLFCSAILPEKLRRKKKRVSQYLYRWTCIGFWFKFGGTSKHTKEEKDLL